MLGSQDRGWYKEDEDKEDEENEDEDKEDVSPDEK